jgi:hypothetical protein
MQGTATVKNPSDITFTLLRNVYDAYRVSTHTTWGESFIAAHLPDHTADSTVQATEQRKLTVKAERCGLAVRIE